MLACWESGWELSQFGLMGWDVIFFFFLFSAFRIVSCLLPGLSQSHTLHTPRTFGVPRGRPAGEKSCARISARRRTSGLLLLRSLSLCSLFLNLEARNVEYGRDMVVVPSIGDLGDAAHEAVPPLMGVLLSTIVSRFAYSPRRRRRRRSPPTKYAHA